jgi:hypothetical protein
MRPRHHRAADADLRERVGDVEHVLGLEPEVELLRDRLREQLHQRGRVRERRDGNPPDQERGDPGHRAQVALHEPGDLRPLHLHDDLFARAQPRRVHLRDRRGREALLVETREHRLERLTQVFLDDGAHRRERLGGRVRAGPELVHDLVGEETAAGRDDLAELDVGRAEPLERLRSRRESAARDSGWLRR